MARTSIPTPCPVPATASHRLSSITSHYDLPDDTTTNIDYTRALGPSLKSSKPRRSSMFPTKAQRTAPVTIFEDVKEDEELVLESSQPSGKTLLGKPAKKATLARVGPTAQLRPVQTGGLQEVKQAPSRPFIRKSQVASMDNRQEETAETEKNRRQSLMAGQVRKDPRRRTIFMPEDTTIMTIHPGAGTANRLDDTFQLPSFAVQPPQSTLEEEPDSLVSSKKPIKRPRRSLAVAPKRVPFAPIHAESNVEGFDVCGMNTGKENVPPAGEKLIKEERRCNTDKHAPVMPAPRSRLTQPTVASRSRQSVSARNAVPIPGLPQTLAPRDGGKAPGSRSTYRRTIPSANPSRLAVDESRTDASLARTVARNDAKVQEAEEKKKLREVIAKKRMEMQTSKLKQYPVLLEDLAQPELYEEGWLSDQEVSLTEIINEIFSANNNARPVQTTSMRKDMIELYHQSAVATLHRRLQASFIYGALSRPKTLTEAPDLTRDIGLRKRFLSLWLESYDEDALRTAAEVVVGREVPRQPAGSPNMIKSSEEILDPRAGRRSLTAFLETFFVTVGDLESNVSGGLSPDTMRWRKTMLRSIMLIWLLDQAKTSTLIKGCLFQRSATRKSSTAVLYALASMLMPSLGDIVRILKQMDYEVEHVQDPLDEVEYQVDSIAVDLRDGILLTHLVETLIYNKQVIQNLQCHEDATITVNMPDATVLCSSVPADVMQKPPRLLSQHLKMPALAHAQKAFNVQVALSALEETGIAGANVVGDITAEDIVHGHREKTLSFLWSLVSMYGLNHLVDWRTLAQDIQRKTGDASDLIVGVAKNGAFAPADQDELLRLWAATYAGHDKARNLTTSFADGKIYAAILSGFAPYYTTSHHATLEDRLKSLGCSAAFTKQITSTLNTIPSRETTISNLAFLASRSLPLARRHHAAATIQRAWRKKTERLVASQRVKLMRMARDCATVVQTGQKMASAATVLQRAWRSVLAARIGRLEEDVAMFQVVARGWAVRWRAKKSRNAVGYTSRTMAGWRS